MTEEEILDNAIMIEETILEDMDLTPTVNYKEIIKKHNKISEMKEKLRGMYDER